MYMGYKAYLLPELLFSNEKGPSKYSNLAFNLPLKIKLIICNIFVDRPHLFYDI